MWLLLVTGFCEMLKADWLSFGLSSLWEFIDELALIALGGSIPEGPLVDEATVPTLYPAAAPVSFALLGTGLMSVTEEFLASSANCFRSGSP